MDSYHQTHHFPRAPPPPPPPPSSTADPYHHHQQSSLRPPVPPQGPWFPNQFQYHPSHSASPTPPTQWGPPAPHSDHAPPPPGAYLPPPHPYASQPMHHNQFPPPRPLMFQHLPPHSQVPQSYSQEWSNSNWAPHQGWEYRAQGNEEDWAARARAWADAKTAMESQQSQFAASTGRLEEQNYYHDQYSQPINSNHPDMSHQPLPPTTYEQFPASAASVARPPAAHHLESTPVTVSSEQSSYLSDGRPTYSVGDGSYGGNMNSVLHQQGKLSSSPSVHQQEVPSSNYSVTGKEETVDQNVQSFKPLPLQNSSVHDGQQHFQPSIPPPYAYGNEPGPVGPMTNLADQPLDFAPRFSHDHGLRTHSGFARNDRGIDSGVPMPSLNSWSSIAPSMVYPPIPPVLASGTQLDPSVAVPSSVPGHTPPPFGRFAGSGITPAIPAAAAPFPGAALPPTVLSGDAYGISNMSERPKKASVPNWLREEIKKAVITNSSADHAKEDAELMEDQGADKSFTKGDQTDSKSVDSSRSTEEEEDEDFVEGARTAAINQEIKRVLTEVLLKVTDELFDEIATKVLDEDDLAIEAKLNIVPSNQKQNVSSSTLPVSTPKGSSKGLIPVKVQEPDNDDTSEKSSSSSPGDVLGLGNYASDDEKNDDRDGEIQTSNVHGSKIKFNIEPSSTKRTLREMQDAVGNASTQGNVIEHSRNHIISDVNDGSTSSVNEMSKSTGFNKLNGDLADGEMGQEHSMKPSSKVKDNETKFGDGTASGTKDILGMVSEQHGKNVNGKKGSKDPEDGETKIKPHNSGKQESVRGSSLKDHVKEEGELKTRTNEKADENRRKQDPRHLRKEETDDQNVQKEKLKDQSVKSGEKGKNSDSRNRSTHHNSKEERREDKLLRTSTKDGRKREYTKDEEGRTRQKISSDSSRHKSSRDRSKDKAVDHSTNSSDDSDDSKRKVNSRKRDKSPSPIRSKRRQVSRSPHSKHSQRRHSPFSSLETTRARRSRSRSPARRRR